jgi:hypothetical protein
MGGPKRDFHFLSEQLYVLSTPNRHTEDYTKGVRVRLISGVDNSDVPGYHFSRGWRTVCREDAREAEWIGVPLSSLRKVRTKRTAAR